MRHLGIISATVLSLALMANAAPAQAPSTTMPAQLRIGYKAAATGPCAPADAKTPAAVASLAKHLAGRLQLSVQLCPFADPADAATALAQGSVDFAKLTPASWNGVKGKGRPILTWRAQGQLPRTPVYAIAREGKLTPAAIAQRRVVLVHQDSLAYDLARAALASRGGEAILRAQTPVAGNLPAALDALGAGRADVMLTPADIWSEGCKTEKARCAPYHIAWADRPLAESAWVLRGGFPDELRYRLIGIFLALHLENAQAYAGAAEGKGQFSPAEATALDAPKAP